MTYDEWKRAKELRAGCIAYARRLRCVLSAERNAVYFAYYAHKPITDYAPRYPRGM